MIKIFHVQCFITYCGIKSELIPYLTSIDDTILVLIVARYAEQEFEPLKI